LARATPALAQQPDAGPVAPLPSVAPLSSVAPLPSVVYPNAVGGVAMPPPTPLVQAPDAGVTVVEPPVQYVVLGGFMGFRDHAGVFHPLRPAAASRPQVPPATIGEGRRPISEQRPPFRPLRPVLRLPNPPPRVIVAPVSVSHEHGPAR
jgi:hypothetical protein